jgi:ligand-binding SRPBCC domain-containing protein
MECHVVSEETLTVNTHIYEKRTVMRTTMEKMMAFHQHPAALSRLSPPPIFVRLHRDERRSLTEGDIEFTLWFGIFPVHWKARQQPGPTETSFADLMVEGPLAYWRHEHIFENVPGGVALTDRVTLAHRPGIPGLFTRLMFDGLPLRFLFLYRHLRTRISVES